MACCDEVTCGTGGWTGPKPGDPDNNVVLSAVGVAGGIRVSWTYPNNNPHAVIHTKLYRGISSNFANAVQQAIVSGSTYFDAIAEEDIKRYYYWIQIVSVNGTVGDPIGPASAEPLSLKELTLEYLTGEIDEGVLAQALKTKIAQLDIITRNLAQEILDRINGNAEFANALAAVSSSSGEALTYIQQEITERRDADSALITSVNALAVGMGDNAAALVEEVTLRTSADESLATSVGILYANTADNVAAILAEEEARTTAVNSLASQVNSLVAVTENNAAVIVQEQAARTEMDAAMASRLDAMVVKTDTTAAAVQTETNARTTADNALASQITTTQTVLGNNISSVQTNMQTQINTTNGKVTEIGALYTAKVDVNGLVGGFGIYNNGTFVDAGFDVDRFWVGRTVNKVKPFVISGGVVYIDKARIRDADIDTLKIAGNAVTIPMSTNFGDGVASATLNYNGYIPSGTKLIVMVSCSNPWVLGVNTNTMVINNSGSQLCSSFMEAGLQTFITVSDAVNSSITVSTTLAVNGLNVSILGCRR